MQNTPNNIVIADDDGVTRVTLGNQISNKLPSANIINVADRMSGLGVIVRNLPDLIWSDVNMPHMNGIDMIRNASEIRGQFFSVLNSSNFTEEMIQKILHLWKKGMLWTVLNKEDDDAREQILNHAPLLFQPENLALAEQIGAANLLIQLRKIECEKKPNPDLRSEAMTLAYKQRLIVLKSLFPEQKNDFCAIDVEYLMFTGEPKA